MILPRFLPHAWFEVQVLSLQGSQRWETAYSHWMKFSQILKHSHVVRKQTFQRLCPSLLLSSLSRTLPFHQHKIHHLHHSISYINIWFIRSGLYSATDTDAVKTLIDSRGFCFSEHSAYGERRWFPHRRRTAKERRTFIPWWKRSHGAPTESAPRRSPQETDQLRDDRGSRPTSSPQAVEVGRVALHSSAIRSGQLLRERRATSYS